LAFSLAVYVITSPKRAANPDHIPEGKELVALPVYVSHAAFAAEWPGAKGVCWLFKSAMGLPFFNDLSASGAGGFAIRGSVFAHVYLLVFVVRPM
jgi:hypothetical protein